MTTGGGSARAISDTEPLVLSPMMLWLPGTLMLWFGSWGVIDGGIGWAWGVWPPGLALLIVGAAAQGVAWGMDIHADRHS